MYYTYTQTQCQKILVSRNSRSFFFFLFLGGGGTTYPTLTRQSSVISSHFMTSAFGVKLSSADSCRNPLWRVAADAVQDSHFCKNTREKIQRVSLEKKGGQRLRGVGNVRTSNPNSASRVRSGTFFSVV